MRGKDSEAQRFGWRLPKAMQQGRECKVKGQEKLCPSVLGGVQRLQVRPEGLSENIIVSVAEMMPAKTQNLTITSCPNDSYLNGEHYPDISPAS